jgi:hypothetical protein
VVPSKKSVVAPDTSDLLDLSAPSRLEGMRKSGSLEKKFKPRGALDLLTFLGAGPAQEE